MKRAGILCLGLFLAGCQGEPSYEGQSLSAWQQQLKADNYMARARACRALGSIGAPAKDSVPELIHCLDDAQYMVRLEAIQALGYLGDAARPALPRLLEITRDPNPELGHAARLAIKHIDETAWEQAREQGQVK
jgi:HEAT repeat protein